MTSPLARRNPLVHRLMRTAIRLRNDCEMRKSLQQSERRICRCAIDDDVLNIRIALPHDAFDRFDNVALAVQAWRNDADPRQIGLWPAARTAKCLKSACKSFMPVAYAVSSPLRTRWPSKNHR